MKVTFEMNEETLRDAVKAINCYLEMCDSPITHCEGLDEQDKEDLEGLELCFAAALVGDEIHKAILAQTEDKHYKEYYNRKWEI